MNDSTCFHRRLGARILTAAMTALLAPVAVQGCGSTTTTTATTSTGTAPYERCFDLADAGGGGAGGAGLTSCPKEVEANSLFEPSCGETLVSDGTLKNGQCCYQAQSQSCLTGRPFVVEGGPVRAPERRGVGRGWSARELVPSIAGLAAGDRATLARLWADDASMEHASVASFARFALELMAFGAPPDLIDLAHSAARDEIEHARIGFSIASAYAGEPIEPGAFPFGGAVRLATRIEDLVTALVREGCIGETLAAIEAAERARCTEDDAVRAALETIAEDEANHAEFAWRALGWALATGGERAITAASAAFEEGAPALAARGLSDESFLARGVLTDATRDALLEEAFRRIVRPAAGELLRARAGGSVSS